MLGAEVRDRVRNISGHMGSQEQREFMYCLGRMTTQAAEIGTWHGLSACIVGLGLVGRGAKIYCVDTFEASNKELNKENTLDSFNRSRHELGISEHLVPVVGWSYDQKTLDAVPNELDWIYIDGDHETPSVIQDGRLWIPKVMRLGWVFFHDRTWSQVAAGIEQLCQDGLIYHVTEIDDFGIYRKR